MSTMDSLFLRIIDCKSRIEGKLHPQLESYCESLSWNVIADGERPPPFMLEIGRTAARCPDLGGLNKEQLVQRLFFPFLNNSLANPGASSNISVMRDGNDLINKEATKINKQNHNQAVEAKVVVDCSELEELNNNKKAGRTTRLRAASKMVDCEKDSFVTNNFTDLQNGYGGRVTRSKSRLLAKEFNTSDKLDGELEELSNNKESGRTTGSMTTSKKVDCEKESFVANNFTDMQNGYGGRVTHSMSRSSAIKFNTSDKLDGELDELNNNKESGRTTGSMTASKKVDCEKKSFVANNFTDMQNGYGGRVTHSMSRLSAIKFNTSDKLDGVLDELKNNKKVGRTTRSMAASKKVDCEKDSFVENNFTDMQNGYGGRVTRSMSRLSAIEFNTSDKLDGAETYFINGSKRPMNYGYENSWPKWKKIKYKSSNIIATSPRLRDRPFPDINQQSECKHKTKMVSEAIVQNNTLYIPEDDSDFNSNFSDLVIDPNGDRQIKALQEVEDNPSACSGDEARPTNLMPSESEIHRTSPDTEFIFSYVDASENQASESLGHYDKSKDQDYAPQCLYKRDITTVSDTTAVKSNCDETMPEFEGFKIHLPYTLEDNIIYKDVDIPRIAKERAFVIEQLRLSSIFPSPSSKPSIMNKIGIISDDFHSSPQTILENMDLDFSLEHNNPDIKNFTTSSSIKLMDICNIGSKLDGNTLERSHSLSSSSALFSSELKNPPLSPPVRKFSYGRFSGKMSSSSATVSSIPELKCFRIDENSLATEENADFVHVGYSTYRSSSRNIEASSNRKSSSDVTALYQNDTGFLSNFKEFVVRDSLESARSDVASSLGFDYAGRESKMENKKKLRPKIVIKKSPKAARRMNKLSERSKLSCESSESIGNYQNIRKGCKSSNILSNVSSFVPQILQKQQGALPLQGMKDIKVKALKTAEAAKRLEEQKKIEREKRKADAKLEWEKLKQENAKLLKLKQKQKEQERRKKEEDVAARKRQREEEERKVKERKRQCIEEKRTLQRECANKLHYEKDEKDFQQKDQKQKKRIPPRKLQKKSERVDGSNGSQMATDVLHPNIQCASDTNKLADDKIQALGPSDEHSTFEKEAGSSSVFREANKDAIHTTQSSQDLLSYEMTPYLNSDDEDEEDSLHKKKHIPLWTRKENLIEIILSTQHLDPKEIFSRKRSFNTSQVLLNHTLQRRRLLM